MTATTPPGYIDNGTSAYTCEECWVEVRFIHIGRHDAWHLRLKQLADGQARCGECNGPLDAEGWHQSEFADCSRSHVITAGVGKRPPNPPEVAKTVKEPPGPPGNALSGGGETWPMKGLSDIHLRHWQVCSCLADKAICCVPDCLCKNALIDGTGAK